MRSLQFSEALARSGGSELLLDLVEQFDSFDTHSLGLVHEVFVGYQHIPSCRCGPSPVRIATGCSGAVGLDVGRRVEEAEVGIASLGHAPTGEFRRRRRRNRPLFLGFPFLSQQLSRQARGRLVLVLVLVLLLLLLFLFFWLLVFLSLLLLLLLLFSFGLLQWCWR